MNSSAILTASFLFNRTTLSQDLFLQVKGYVINPICIIVSILTKNVVTALRLYSAVHMSKHSGFCRNQESALSFGGWAEKECFVMRVPLPLRVNLPNPDLLNTPWYWTLLGLLQSLTTGQSVLDQLKVLDSFVLVRWNIHCIRHQIMDVKGWNYYLIMIIVKKFICMDINRVGLW